MPTPLTPAAATTLISPHLRGSSVDRLTYGITYWDVRFNSGVLLSASELRVSPSAQLGLSGSRSMNDEIPSACLVGGQLLAVTNSHPVDNVLIDPSSVLVCRFQNGLVLQALAIVDQVDWTWTLDLPDGSRLTCDSGPLFLSNRTDGAG
ncbi:MAG: hypothetical protein IPJ78_19535 [Gemmatimonadetes bacterium]|nr:hypothetical protein [Gemmatimonadota bacterium]